MLRKWTSLFLAFLLLVSSAGLAFNVHFCGERIAGVSSFYSEKEPCDDVAKSPEKACCAKEVQASHKKCCSDKPVDLKDKTDEVIIKHFTFNIDFISVPDSWTPLVSTVSAPIQKSNKAAYDCDANAPPLFKLYSRYILYA